MDIDKNKIYAPDMPMGLDIALAKNEAARDYFYSLAEAEQRRIIDHTHSIGSKEEMQSYVDSLAASLTGRG
jgi:uncharacterized protein YdeI (YjbR/CyaY-like superfamily)